MRTTLTIDDDLAGILKRRSRETSLSFRDIVNAALRRGLVEETVPAVPPVTVRPHDFGKIAAGIDPDRMNQLVDELHAADFLRRP